MPNSPKDFDQIEKTLGQAAQGNDISSSLDQLDMATKDEVDQVVSMQNAIFGAPNPITSAAAINGQFLNYRLIQLLGAGGQGTVYLAEDVSGKRFAIKILRRAKLASYSQLKRFQREAEILSKLDHPRIRTCFESGVHQDEAYIVMEYVEGQSLDAIIAKDRRSKNSLSAAQIKQRILWCEEIVHALGAAHDAGVIHRDLKPSNIVIANDGEPSILDFGLAHIDMFSKDSLLTATGDIVGTPAYMAPEQRFKAIGAISERTDIYSLGTLLYELISSERPETLDSFGRLCDPNIEVLKKESIPNSLIPVLGKALEISPKRRYQSATDLAAELKRIRLGQAVVARSPSAVTKIHKWIVRNKLVAMGTLIVISSLTLALGMSLWALKKSTESQAEIAASLRQSEAHYALSQSRLINAREPGRAITMALEAAKHADESVVEQTLLQVIENEFENRIVTEGLGKIIDFRIAPDGTNICVLLGNGNLVILDSTSGKTLSEGNRIPNDVGAICWQGATLWYANRAGEIHSIQPNAERVEPRKISKYAITAICISKNSPILLVSDETGVITAYDVDRKTVTWQTKPVMKKIRSLSLSHDDKTLAVLGESQTVFIIDALNGKVTSELVHNFLGTNSAAFSPDNKSLLTASADNKGWIWNLLEERPELFLSGHESGVHGSAWHPQAQFVYTTSYDRTIRVWSSVDGQLLRTLKGHRGSVVRVQYSPLRDEILSASHDGTIRAWPARKRPESFSLRREDAMTHASYPSPNGDYLAITTFNDVQIVEAKRGSILAHHESFSATAFAWLNNRQYIFVKGRHLICHDMSTKAQSWKVFLPKDLNFTHALSSPQAQRIFLITRDRRGLLLDAQEKTIVKGFPALGPFYRLGNVARSMFSPCGRWLAVCTAEKGGTTSLVVRDAKTGDLVRRLPRTETQLVCLSFHPQSKLLLYGESKGRVHAHWMEGSVADRIFTAHSEGVNDIAFTPSGDQFATAGRDKVAYLWRLSDFKKLATYSGHDSVLYGVAISQDGKKLATNSWDKTAGLFDLASGTRLLTQDLHKAPVTELHFLPNSESIATLSSLNAEVRVWPQSPLKFARKSIAIMTRELKPKHDVDRKQ